MTANHNRNFIKVMLICAIFEFIGLSLYLFAYFINIANLEKVLCYHEDEYEMIEKEAERMVLNEDFETEYKLNIISLDEVKKTLRMRLYNNLASVEVRADNYGEDDVVIEYDRDYNNQNEKISYYVRSIFVISFVAIFFINVEIYLFLMIIKEAIHLLKIILKK